MTRPPSEPSPRPHIIRLRNPWQWECRAPEGNRAQMQRLYARRRFHRPTGLEPGVRVLLRLQLPAVAHVSLNDCTLAGPHHSDAHLDVTAQLAERNELVLDLACQCDEEVERARALIAAGAVQLEIRSDCQG